MFRNGLPKQSIQELEDIHQSKRTTFATSKVSGALSVLLKHILRSFHCMYTTAPVGLGPSLPEHKMMPVIL
jgi:hypothetical protein